MALYPLSKPNPMPHVLPTVGQSVFQKPLGASGWDLLYIMGKSPQYEVKESPLMLALYSVKHSGDCATRIEHSVYVRSTEAASRYIDW